MLVKSNEIVARINDTSFDRVGWSFLSASNETEGVMFLLVAKYKGVASGEIVEN